jgi:hypothetical protein
LTTVELADELRLSDRTLQQMRGAGTGHALPGSGYGVSSITARRLSGGWRCGRKNRGA